MQPVKPPASGDGWEKEIIGAFLFFIFIFYFYIFFLLFFFFYKKAVAQAALVLTNQGIGIFVCCINFKFHFVI